MPTRSAGLLMFTARLSEIKFFLIHPGGPFYKNKNEGVWSIPKGIPNEGEDLLVAAQREFQEETGITPSGPFIELGQAKTKSGKVMYIWAFEGSWNESDGIVSNTFPLEWPPQSGKTIQVPEADRARWSPYHEAVSLINPQQRIFLERLLTARQP